MATEELNIEWFISKCSTDQTIWQVATEHVKKGLLERVGKNGAHISKITFCLPIVSTGSLPQGLSKNLS